MTGSFPVHNQAIDLQATIAMSSAITDPVAPHHPITCPSRLWLHEDGRFECEHVVVPPGDTRTNYAIDHSIALLLIECALDRFTS